MESLSHMYVLPYHILGNLLREEKQGAHPAAPPNVKADGGVLMQVKSYAARPPGKAASMRRSVMMYPARPHPRTDSTLPLSSSHRAEREEGRRHCHRSLLYEKPGSRPCPGCRMRRLYPSVHRWRRSDRSLNPRAF